MRLNLTIRRSESSATPILFHYTKLGSVLEMLRSNEIALTTGIGTPADNALGKTFYYLSMSRTRLGEYHIRRDNQGAVLLTLNGDLLNQRYKTKPVDYWGEDSRIYKKGAYEQEDRLFSNKPTIPNARKYIMSIDLLMPDKGLFDKRFSKKLQMRELLKTCLVNKISCHIYENSNDWLVGNVAKAKHITIADLAPSDEDEKYKPYDRYADRRNTTKDDYLDQRKFKSHSYVSCTVELYYKKSLSDLSKDASDFSYKLSYDRNGENYATLANEVHNERSNAPAERKALDALIVILHKEKLTLRELYDKLVIKWTALRGG